MTINELYQMDKEFLSVADVASIMRCSPQILNRTALEEPEKLGFPVIRVGKRAHIPRRAFLRYIEGDGDA